jgi:hypothetical protein
MIANINIEDKFDLITFLNLLKNTGNKFNIFLNALNTIDKEKIEDLNNKMSFNFNTFITFFRQYFNDITAGLDEVIKLSNEEDKFSRFLLNFVSKNDESIYNFLRNLKEQDMFDFVKIPYDDPITEDEIDIVTKSPNSLSKDSNLDYFVRKVLAVDIAFSNKEDPSESTYQTVKEEISPLDGGTIGEISTELNNLDMSIEDVVFNMIISVIFELLKLDRFFTTRFITALHRNGIGITQVIDKEVPIPKEEEIDIFRNQYFVSKSLEETSDELKMLISNILITYKSLSKYNNASYLKKIKVLQRRCTQAVNILGIILPENKELKSITQKEKEIIYL